MFEESRRSLRNIIKYINEKREREHSIVPMIGNDPYWSNGEKNPFQSSAIPKAHDVPFNISYRVQGRLESRGTSIRLQIEYAYLWLEVVWRCWRIEESFSEVCTCSGNWLTMFMFSTIIRCRLWVSLNTKAALRRTRRKAKFSFLHSAILIILFAHSSLPFLFVHRFEYISNILTEGFRGTKVYKTRCKNLNSLDPLTFDGSALYPASCESNRSRNRLFQLHFENWHTDLLKGIYAMTSVGFPT